MLGPLWAQVPTPIWQPNSVRALQMHSSLVQRLDLEKIMEVSRNSSLCLLEVLIRCLTSAILEVSRTMRSLALWKDDRHMHTRYSSTPSGFV